MNSTEPNIFCTLKLIAVLPVEFMFCFFCTCLHSFYTCLRSFSAVFSNQTHLQENISVCMLLHLRYNTWLRCML